MFSFDIIDDIGICGCGVGNDPDAMSCCETMDLGMIYELVPDYAANSPCLPTRQDEYICPPDSACYCVITPDPSPYGDVLEYKRACARLVVWNAARIKDGSISGERRVLYSRQRKDLPKIVGGECVNPIRCPAQNEIFSCCKGNQASLTNTLKSHVGGPYKNCKLINQAGKCEISCSGKTPPYKYGVSNCEFNGHILAGYATAPSNWWFLQTSEFSSVVSELVQNNPYEKQYQTLYAHFQVEWKPLRCWTNGGSLICGGKGRVNRNYAGRCGTSTQRGLADKEERERHVKITAAIGWSLGGCGYNPEKSCLLTDTRNKYP